MYNDNISTSLIIEVNLEKKIVKLLQAWPLTAVATLSILPALLSLGVWYNIAINFSPSFVNNKVMLIGQLNVIIMLIAGIVLLFGSKKSIIFYLIAALLSVFLFYNNFPFRGLLAVWNGHQATSIQVNNLMFMAKDSAIVLLRAVIFLVVVLVFSKKLE